MAEHRMYLPLAAVAALVVVAAYAGLRRLADRHWLSRPSARGARPLRGGGHRGGTGAATFEATAPTAMPRAMRDTLNKAPATVRAQNISASRCWPGASSTRRWNRSCASQLSDPSEVPAGINYGGNLCGGTRIDAAIAECREAVRRRPGSAEAHAT